MTTFINLHRCFRTLSDSELLDPESLAALNDYAPSMSMAWPDLLLLRRVVILAEAGSGKTREMREQANRLQAEGKYAFFLPVESLDQSLLVDLLSVQNEGQFNNWKADGDAIAWFFLDAVDELKLTDGKLDRALLRFSKSVDAQLGRVRIILSCRPNDWRPNSDLASFRARLPVPVQSPVMESATSEAIFLDVLASDQRKSSHAPVTRNGTEALDTVHLVALLPLSDRQISQYAGCSGIDDSELLLQEIQRQDAWTFARRPLDLAEIIGVWISSRCLGTRTQQHEANIDAKLREDPGRSGRGALSEALARVGAERLGLALALTRNRSLKSPDQALDIQRAPDVLDPAAVLSDWTEEQRQALMRRALFDPATYGRVRFHHRSVQEYLAARCLWGLREQGMSIRALFRLLFAERYGVGVVFPSMRPIAAWLAQWDSVVREELMAREPEVLLLLGDPEALDISARTRLVRRFAEFYGRGGWRGIRIPVSEIRRLAHSELAGVVHEIWDQGLENSDVRELLIELIRQGPIVECAGLAYAAAIDLKESNYCRVRAIQALIACGDDSAVREIVESMLANPDSWGNKVLRGILSDLFPRIINADELIILLTRDIESEVARDGFGRDLSLIVKEINPLSNEAIALRDRLAELIWCGRNSDLESYCIVGKYDYFVDALAELCCRQLEGIRDQVSELLIRACIIASRFKGDQDKSESVERLRLCFKGQPILRARVFWAELAFMDEAVPAQNDWQRYVDTKLGSLVEPLDEGDHGWLMTALCDVGAPERRAVALHALAYDWRGRGAIVSETEVLRVELLGDVELEALLDQLIAPVPPDESMNQSARDREAQERAEAAEEAERLQTWSDWRRVLITDPIAAFTPDQADSTLSDLCVWLEHLHGRHNQLDVWDRDAVAQAFSAEVASLAENTCRALWRVSAPQLWSERPEAERRSIPYRWVSGLYGLSAESELPGWAKRLSSEEARVAAIYATIELDRFAPFINDLAAAHPESVEAVIGSELIAEFGMVGEGGCLPVWQHLVCADQELRALLVPPVIASLREWPTVVPDETRLPWDQHLDLVFRVLDGVLVKRDLDVVATECEKHYRGNPRGPSALIWLRGLFRFDAERGAQAFIDVLAAFDPSEVDEYVTRLLAGLFGNRDVTFADIADVDRRAHMIWQLVILAHRHIRMRDDQIHEGIYSPDIRDRAETARDFLLSTLLDAPGVEAQRRILELAETAEFAFYSDYLRLRAYEHAAVDAEFPPYDVASVVTMVRCGEVLPHDRDSIFEIMMDRLEDLAHELAHDDFSDRRLLQRIGDEIEMQRTLAMRLRSQAKGAYQVAREEEVADQKRTDIRLSTMSGGHKAVVEIKLADARWSLSELKQALTDQLLGQYLRHIGCRAGCLLLTYDGSKKYWIHPHTKKRMSFVEMVAYLNEQAKELEASETAQSVRLAVFGLDLTDPLGA